MDRTPKTLHVCPTAWDINWEATAAFREKRVSTTEYIHKEQLLVWLESLKDYSMPQAELTEVNIKREIARNAHNAAIDTVIEKLKET